MTALRNSVVLGSAGDVWQLGRGGNSLVVPKRVGLLERAYFGGFSGLSVQRAIRSAEDESSSKSATELRRAVDQTETGVSKRVHKDLTSFPRPLTVSDFSPTPENKSKMRVAFKAVELWLVDKAVLPIENSSGGSLHRNYDLLLRHRLHIVAEVQMTVNLCLLALPGVTAEQLKRVLSHPQALSLSDGTLTGLGVTRESVDSTAGAAQFVALNELRDAGVVASARAADIYGLNVLAERIQESKLVLISYVWYYGIW